MPQSRVAIIGGGPAGAAAAITLAALGISAAVFESAPGPQDKPGESLPPQCTPVLQRLGLMDRLVQGSHLRCHGNRSRWGQKEAQERSHFVGPYGPGWRLDRREFEAALAHTAMERGVHWQYGARVRKAERHNRVWHITLQRGNRVSEVTADFLIDASGRRASLARQLGSKPVAIDRLAAVVSELRPPGKRIEDTFTMVEAVPSGWWYAAAIPNGNLAVLYVTDHDLPQFRAARNPQCWWTMLVETTDLAAPIREYGFRPLESPQAVTAASCHLSSIAGDGWLAAGDAAAAHDPLSSHGIAAALGSGYYAAFAASDLLSARDEARQAYLTLMQRAWDAYCAEGQICYSSERRWPKEPFWERRHLLNPALTLAAPSP
jgi:flavin-dependent dehydrogenase